MKSLKRAIVTTTLGLICLNVDLALAATRIKFAPGSYCGSYSGNFVRGRDFVLGLRRGQTLTTRNIGGGTQYNLDVSGPTGSIRGRQEGEDQINYPIPATGDYYISVVASTDFSNIEFCAY
ncbi:MAG: hypothetical protein N5P05_001446 [Chroococcopsis gigantea SAG 12.99]|jgi:hypothetical protein|nr:hypothetical protein [Chlorogloea purpurea SAG 13.99]MDV2999840.1 hypothetical protein [Chroococcopsis gigantea SAG 12.99]